MKKTGIIVVATFCSVLMLAGCGGSKTESTVAATTVEETTVKETEAASAEESETESVTETEIESTVESEPETTAAEEDPDEYIVHGPNLTITVPRIDTFFDFPNAEIDCSVEEGGGKDTFAVEITTEGMERVYVFAVNEDVVRQDYTIQDYLEYYNSRAKDDAEKYNLCEIAGYNGVVQVKTVESRRSTEHIYYLEVPMDGETHFIKFYVRQSFNSDITDLPSLEETFLNNITIEKS